MTLRPLPPLPRLLHSTASVRLHLPHSSPRNPPTFIFGAMIADAFALYTKTKNFHWYLAGSHLCDYHLLFDEQADQIFESIDTLAERVRRVGGTTIRSISHISRLQTINDDNDDFVSAGEIVRHLMQDNTYIADLQRAAIEVCNKNRGPATSNQLESILNETKRRR